MIRAAAELMQRRGWYGAGLNDILERAQAPRGSLYHHFPGGKAALATEGVRQTGLLFARQLTEAGADKTDIGSYLRALAELSGRDLTESAFEAACPVAAIALDAPQAEEELMAACNEAFALWLVAITDRLRPMMQRPDRADILARVVATTLLGGTMLARAGRTSELLPLLAQDLAVLAEALDG